MRRATAAAIFFLIAVPLSAAPEKWLADYNQGVQAVNAGNFSWGVKALERAIAQKPTEATNVKVSYGVGRSEIIPVYLPHFFLGIANLSIGDADGALRELKISEDQGIIQSTDYYAKLKVWRSQAEARKQRNAESAAADSRSAADAAVSAAMKAQVQAIGARGDSLDPFRAGKQKLDEARRIKESAGTDIAAYKRAADVATEARRLFVAAKEEASRPKPDVIVVPVEPVPQPKPPVPAPTPSPAPAPMPVTPPAPVPVPVPAPPPTPVPLPPTPVSQQTDVQPLPEALVDARLALQSYRRRLTAAAAERRDDAGLQRSIRHAIDEAKKLDLDLKPTANAAMIQRVAGTVAQRDHELSDLLKPQPAVVVSPPSPQPPTVAANNDRAKLESAYRAFAGGDLAASEQLLNELISANPTPEAYALRGCTRYTRAMLSRKGDLSAASEDFRAALRLNAALRLDKMVFSPKLVDYFESVRRQ